MRREEAGKEEEEEEGWEGKQNRRKKGLREESNLVLPPFLSLHFKSSPSQVKKDNKRRRGEKVKMKGEEKKRG